MSKPITPNQVRFITSLLSERQQVLEITDVAQFIADQDIESLTSRSASAFIDELKRVPVRIVEALPTSLPAELGSRAQGYRTNGYGGTCATCGEYVKPQAGYIVKDAGRWLTYHHDGEHPVAVVRDAYVAGEGTVRTVETPFTLTEGIYDVNGVIVKVVWNQGHTRLYGKALTARCVGFWSDGTERYDASWEYAPGLTKSINASTHKLSAEEAAEWGALYGICCACGRELSDERSIVAGYGETCSNNNGWYYPTKQEAAAKITPEQALRVAELKAAKK